MNRLRLGVLRRDLASGGCMALLATAALLVVPSATAAQAASAVVTDGNARFTVLTPTLIRLEYAGDSAFQDATTFNAVQRNFPVPPFTTGVSPDGYREIRTGALTLRYRQGSGPFTASNVSVLVTATNVAAAPVFPS